MILRPLSSVNQYHSTRFAFVRSLRPLQKLRSHSWDSDELQPKLGRSFLEEEDLLEAVPELNEQLGSRGGP